MKKWLGIFIITVAVIFAGIKIYGILRNSSVSAPILAQNSETMRPVGGIPNNGPMPRVSAPDPYTVISSSTNNPGWMIYRNDKYGIEFSYPAKYFLNEDQYNVMVSDDPNINEGGPLLYFYLSIQPFDSGWQKIFSATSSYSETGNNGTLVFAPKQWNGINGIEAKGYECEGHCYEDNFYFKLKNGMVGFLNLVPGKLCPISDSEDDPGNGTCPNPDKDVQAILGSFQMISSLNATNTGTTTYRNNILGFEFSYPSVVTEHDGPSYNTTIFDVSLCSDSAEMDCETDADLFVEEGDVSRGLDAFNKRFASSSMISFVDHVGTVINLDETSTLLIDGEVADAKYFHTHLGPPYKSDLPIDYQDLWIQFSHNDLLFTLHIPQHGNVSSSPIEYMISHDFILQALFPSFKFTK